MNFEPELALGKVIDGGQFSGSVRDLDGYKVPTGFGYIVFSFNRRHFTLLQGDWQVISSDDSSVSLQIFGQKISCDGNCRAYESNNRA